MLKRMRSQEQLWLQNSLFLSASGTSSEKNRWQVMVVKRLLTYHKQSHGQDNNGYGLQEAQAQVNVGRRNVESPFVAHKQMQDQVQTCRIDEIRTRGHYQIDSHKLGPVYGVLQAHQQVSSSTRGSGHGTHHPQLDFQGSEVLAWQHSNTQGQSRCNEGHGQVPVKVPGNGYVKTIQQKPIMQQSPEVIQQKAVAQRPLPKRLLPIPVTHRSLSTTTGPPSFRKSIAIADSIKLTEVESKIFNILKDFLVHYNLKSVLRVAGGWVRDKLLGKQCGDIDIAIDDMLGRRFCQKLLDYCSLIGMELTGFGVIRSKPAQARHLEVAKMELFGVAVDFVNLRSPGYAESSSKSFTLQGFGTSVEDAYQRDLTINSLFYNINTGLVEDPTGRGLSDLRAGIIATPSPAKDTFRDDPLRALRALRFVSVLGYELHSEAKDAIDADIKLALAVRISRERIGGEVERIFRCNHPLKAMELLVETQLFPVVFRPPAELSITLPEGIERTCLHALGATIDVLRHFGSSKLSGEHRKSLYLAAFLSPLRTHVYEHKHKLVPISTAIIKESLKLRSVDASMVATLHKTAGNYTSIRRLVLKVHAMDQWGGDIVNSEPELQTSYSEMKRQIGKLLEEARGLWRSALLLGTVLEEDFEAELPYEKRIEELRRRLNLCIFVEEAIVKLGLEDITGPYPFVERKSVSENG
ncbi:hypothetical protein GOP47_0006057 [Adiantum capillus-veneris]|uniref:Uncharacterized protein n=1 Tax=Adiantum capillus-veneris TaxID=13818 RepID=A0A9D4ZM68_ADICA|nr:hypothetical protein GOP47_0006057 [Adiantum capillus-veneris]